MTASVSVVETTVIEIDDLGMTYIHLVWLQHNNFIQITSYTISLLDANEQVVRGPTSRTPQPNMEHSFEGLTPGTQYTIDIKTLIDGSTNDFAREAIFTRPKPPKDIVLYQLSSTALLFRWDSQSASVTSLIDYVIRTSRVGSSEMTEIVRAYTATSSMIQGLTPGADYQFSVFASIDPFRSPFAPLTPIAMGASAGVSIGAVTALEMEVLWTVPIAGVQSYLVHLFSEDGTQEYTKAVAADQSSIIFQGLTPDTLYTAVVEAVTAAGSSVAGSDSARTSDFI
ncbi:receptor-type tyrosine-protein phosphatase beta-like [Diadema antillarum]|uniref:receptor-type tyrosine-protein phosphatase beta-like n=1 Tax=Diadema antillarum TaxID=105358 RepID=UPI003A86397B